MRLRLDKLVLSAGLALALVATTIPVGAAVEEASTKQIAGFVSSSNVKMSNESIAAAVTGISAKVEDEKTDAETITVDKALGTVSFTAGAETVGSPGSYLNVYEKDNGLTVGNCIIPGTITVTQVSTYTMTDFPYTSDKATATTDAVATARVEMENITGAIADGTPKTEAYGTKQVKVEEDSTNVLTATSGTDADTYKVSGSYKVTTTYVIKDTSSLGFSYDMIFKAASPSTNDYVIVKEDANDSAAPTVIESSLVNNDTELLVNVTDLTSKYYILSKKVSKSTGLLFATTSGSDDVSASVTVGSYTATIENATAPTGDELTAFTTALTDNNLTKVAYFRITNLPSAISTAAEFKIAEPTDLPAVASGYTREYKVLRYHDLAVQVLDATVDSDGYIVFSSDKFSDFALAYVDVAADTTEEETNNETNNETATEAGTETTTAGSSTTSTTSSSNTADNSMMPLFMTTLLLALCAGSLAIYKEKKTN